MTTALRDAAESATAGVPVVAYRHEITEPGKDVMLMCSGSPDNPWSHWMAEYLGQCVYECTALVPASALDTARAEIERLGRERDEAVFLLDEGGQAYRAISDLEVKLDFLSELDTARAEIERLGKSETVAKSDAAYYAKVLFKFRDTLLNVQDGFEEEGDRTYFGSTNDADQLRDISQKIDGLKWDKIMEASQPPVDLYGLKQASSLDAPAARSMKVVLTDVELDVLSEAIHRAFQAPCDSYGAEILEAVEAKVKAALQVIAEGRH